MFNQLIKSEDGSNIVEYALIIAIVSIVLIALLKPLTVATIFNDIISRFENCLISACI